MIGAVSGTTVIGQEPRVRPFCSTAMVPPLVTGWVIW